MTDELTSKMQQVFDSVDTTETGPKTARKVTVHLLLHPDIVKAHGQFGPSEDEFEAISLLLSDIGQDGFHIHTPLLLDWAYAESPVKGTLVPVDLDTYEEGDFTEHF